MNAIDTPSCSDCHRLNCYRQDRQWPDFCATTALDDDERRGLVDLSAATAATG